MVRRGGWLAGCLIFVACSTGDEGFSPGVQVTASVGGGGSTGLETTPASSSGMGSAETSASDSMSGPTSGLFPTTSGPNESMTGPEVTTGGIDPGTSSSGDETGGPAPSGLECDAEELQLITLANQARAQAGLPAVPVSDNLCAVAHRHVVDLVEQAPHEAGASCLLNSWSDAGDWTPCCYTDPTDQSVCMWEKGRELTDYNGTTLEAAVEANSAASALAAMQADNAANVVLMNIGIWDTTVWQAAGAGIHGGYAVLWYGNAPD